MLCTLNVVMTLITSSETPLNVLLTNDDGYESLGIDLLAQAFALGVRALSPLIVALVFSMIAFAAIHRVLPQLGYFAVGMNVQVLVLLGSVVLFLGVIGWWIDGELATVTERAQLAWKHVLAGSASP